MVRGQVTKPVAIDSVLASTDRTVQVAGKPGKKKQPV
jgi:hypothetical protein